MRDTNHISAIIMNLSPLGEFAAGAEDMLVKDVQETKQETESLLQRLFGSYGDGKFIQASMQVGNWVWGPTMLSLIVFIYIVVMAIVYTSIAAHTGTWNSKIDYNTGFLIDACPGGFNDDADVVCPNPETWGPYHAGQLKYYIIGMLWGTIAMYFGAIVGYYMASTNSIRGWFGRRQHPDDAIVALQRSSNIYEQNVGTVLTYMISIPGLGWALKPVIFFEYQIINDINPAYFMRHAIFDTYAAFICMAMLGERNVWFLWTCGGVAACWNLAVLASEFANTRAGQVHYLFEVYNQSVPRWMKRSISMTSIIVQAVLGTWLLLVLSVYLRKSHIAFSHAEYVLTILLFTIYVGLRTFYNVFRWLPRISGKSVLITIMLNVISKSFLYLWDIYFYTVFTIVLSHGLAGEVNVARIMFW